MLRLLLALALLLIVLPARDASASEPQIYYFGAEGCDFCAEGRSYLKRLAMTDDRIKLREFDIVSNSDDALAFVLVVSAIGLSDPQVPMTIIGHNVIIGYQSDETTGEEIRLTLEQCRATSCRDIVGSLIGSGPEAALVTRRNWRIERRFADAAEKR